MLFPPQSKVKMNRKRQKRKIVIMLIPVALQSIGAVLQFMVYDTTSTRKL
jgi:predicted nucleic acid-binding Zn ribbon protein